MHLVLLTASVVAPVSSPVDAADWPTGGPDQSRSKGTALVSNSRFPSAVQTHAALMMTRWSLRLQEPVRVLLKRLKSLAYSAICVFVAA